MPNCSRHIPPTSLRLTTVILVVLSFLAMQFAGSWHVHSDTTNIPAKYGTSHSILSGQDCPFCTAYLVGPAEIVPFYEVAFITQHLFTLVEQESSLYSSAHEFHSGRAPPSLS